ncbi:hypothetical protein BDV95DRAFT_112029 [Massariosphaeria phaeospora]|uniref:Uncharacterized protein n=1 Tax=Massariosphaeria phaeospora TaxID=100035 RepID=A0A7C8IAB1_9PLEO|nr:hypothetical protein BDV95DRAFT_112029 [Massariosphaeria phaeospora]
MAVTKPKKAVRKSTRVNYGSHIVRLKVGTGDRLLNIHEDLLCANSRFFRQLLQKHRKEIVGECSICHEDLDSEVNNITFCRAKCGQNIHVTCIDRWQASRPNDTTCPMCRVPWKKQENVYPVSTTAGLDPRAVQLYIRWLYSEGCLKINDDLEDDLCFYDDLFNVYLLKALMVAYKLEDDGFKKAVLTAIFDESTEDLGEASVKYVFNDINNYMLQDLVLCLFMTQITTGWFTDESSGFPDAFVKE